MSWTMRRLALDVAVGLALALAVSRCGPGLDPLTDANVTIRADLSGTTAAMVVVEVTAPDITTPLIFNIPIVNNVASGTITIPTGSGRTITVRAYDVNAVETHRGTATLNVTAGTNPTLALLLTPLTGDVPITATLGRITIVVTPATPSVGVGATVTLAATITDGEGHPVTGTVLWASRGPDVASVSAVGVVTGVATGQTTIVATFRGSAGAATVTVP